MILEGKKKNLLKKMEKEMQALSNHRQYEQAADIRNKIFALKHIQDVALISEDKNPSLTLPLKKGEKRICARNDRWD
jgi:excinuclease UvrABC nuclease subunit